MLACPPALLCSALHRIAGLKLKKKNSGKDQVPLARSLAATVPACLPDTFVRGQGPIVIEGAKEGTLPILFPDPGKLQAS
jgi:hypothetical protein